MDREAGVFKVLADATRLRLAVLLAGEGEVCVCRLAEALDEPEYKVSRHLGVLRHAGLVEARRQGTWMYYRLAEAGSELEACLQACFRECLKGHGQAKEDRKRLGRASCGPGAGG